MQIPNSKVIQISTTTALDQCFVRTLLCEDGSVWERSHDSRDWDCILEALPQPDSVTHMPAINAPRCMINAPRDGSWFNAWNSYEECWVYARWSDNPDIGGWEAWNENPSNNVMPTRLCFEDLTHWMPLPKLSTLTQKG